MTVKNVSHLSVLCTLKNAIQKNKLLVLFKEFKLFPIDLHLELDRSDI